tara:strand:+ start:304 stop:1092 length:789 start_codon:yes stop_codon:yes gene_type:complete
MNEKNYLAIALVGDLKYLYKYFNKAYNQIRNEGNYPGEIVVITNYLCPTFLIKNIKKSNNVFVLRFKKIKFDKRAEESLKNLDTSPNPNRHTTKNFQWHKIHLFNKKLKRWNYIFYMDINMNIHFELKHILKNFPNDLLYARGDSYPNYDKSLETQFNKKNNLYKKLDSLYDLSISNYFQTGVLYYDTSIIQETTEQEIIDLVNRFPISATNEQGIMNLYFIFENELYKELPTEVDGFVTYFYWKIKDKKIIITKATTEKVK